MPAKKSTKKNLKKDELLYEDISSSLPVHATKKPKKQLKIKKIVVHMTDGVVTPQGLAKYDIGPNHISKTGCLAPGSRVLTPDGYKNIEDFNVGDQVIAPRTHSSCTVTDVHSRHIEEDVYRLSFALENTSSIIATEEHPFLVFQSPRCNTTQKKKYCLPLACKTKAYHQSRSDKLLVCDGDGYTDGDILSELKWVPASELKEGDLSATYLGEQRIVDRVSRSVYRDFLWLAGLYLADGWKGRFGEIYLAIGDTQIETQATVEAVATSLGRPLNSRQREGCIEYRIGGDIYKDIQMVVKGDRATNKRVSKLYMNASLAEQSIFLDGYIAGDGYVTRDEVRITTVSEELAHQMFLLFARQGKIPCKIIGRPEGTRKIQGRSVHCNQEYIVSYRKDPIYNLGMIVGNYLLFPIKEILKTKYSGQICNLTVDKEESYIVNSISTHNCPTLTYHYLINQSGECFKCVDHTVVTWHAGNHNSKSLAVSLNYKADSKWEKAVQLGVGTDLPKSSDNVPSKKAIEKLGNLLRSLCLQECVPPTKIFGHRELKGTGWTLQKGSKRLRKTCPGMSLDLDLLRQEVAAKLQITMQTSGIYGGEIDGLWGPKSQKAFDIYIA